MRYLIVLVVAGCASSPNFDVLGKNPECSRSCLHSYSACIAASGGTSTVTSAQIMGACRHTADVCLRTCP